MYCPAVKTYKRGIQKEFIIKLTNKFVNKLLKFVNEMANRILLYESEQDLIKQKVNVNMYRL